MGGAEKHRHGRRDAASGPGRSAAGWNRAGRAAAGASECYGRQRANAGNASRFQRHFEQRAEPADGSADATADATASGFDQQSLTLTNRLSRPQRELQTIMASAAIL